jgi:hypothetical protein
MLFFAVLLSVSALDNTYTALADRAREGDLLPFWKPLVWEVTSNLGLWLLIPALAWWLAKFPFARHEGWRSLPAHLLATLPFSLAHTGGMVLLRKLAYRFMGERYDFGPFWDNWLYEYRKDCFAYFVFIGALVAFRVYGLWLDARGRAEDEVAVAAPSSVSADAAKAGERGVPVQSPHPSATSAPASTSPPPSGQMQRLVVRKRNREFILDAHAIDHIEADGNYVIIHTAGETYRLRDSLEGLARRLGEQRFARVHRAHAVNIERIREIQPWDHGDYRIVLKDGSFVNFSRRYRSRLTHLFR